MHGISRSQYAIYAISRMQYAPSGIFKKIGPFIIGPVNKM